MHRILLVWQYFLTAKISILPAAPPSTTSELHQQLTSRCKFTHNGDSDTSPVETTEARDA